MSIADLKVLLADVPGIETLTIALEAGRITLRWGTSYDPRRIGSPSRGRACLGCVRSNSKDARGQQMAVWVRDAHGTVMEVKLTFAIALRE
jgi:hypothetical protein